MKRLFSLTLLLVMVLTILPVNTFAASPTGEKFWIEDNILYWEQEDGVKYDIIFYGIAAIKEGGVFEEIDDDHFDLLKAPKNFRYGIVFISNQNRSSKVAQINVEDDGTLTVECYDPKAVTYIIEETATETTYGWSDLGATQYKVTYQELAIKRTVYVDGVERTITVPRTSTNFIMISVVSLDVIPLDGLYMGQKFPFTINATNTERFYISDNSNGYVVSWDGIDFVSQYRLSYKKSTDSKYTILKAQKNTSVTLPFSKDDTFSIYLEAKADGEWQWIGSRTINGDTLLGDTPESYANGGSATSAGNKITGFKAEAGGDGLVKLSWDSVKGADNYKVYYRKVGASKWSGGTGSFVRTKTSLNVRFKGESEYELKIVAGDKVSGILTVKPSAEKGTVWTKTK